MLPYLIFHYKGNASSVSELGIILFFGLVPLCLSLFIKLFCISSSTRTLFQSPLAEYWPFAISICGLKLFKLRKVFDYILGGLSSFAFLFSDLFCFSCFILRNPIISYRDLFCFQIHHLFFFFLIGVYLMFLNCFPSQ